MARLSEDQVIENQQLVEKLIRTFPEERRGRIIPMLDRIPEYYTAPASKEERFHNCFPGGLADHSLRVTKNLRAIAETLAPGKYPKEQLTFLGLFHDIGKAGEEGKPFYVPNDKADDAWKRKKGWLYEENPAYTYMPMCDRSLYLLQKHGVFLTEEEYIAIRIHDGPYEKCNEKYGMKEPNLAVLLHFADRWAVQQEKAAT